MLNGRVAVMMVLVVSAVVILMIVVVVMVVGGGDGCVCFVVVMAGFGGHGNGVWACLGGSGFKPPPK